VAFRHHDPGGHVYGYRDRETVVRVVLNPEGSLETLYVLRASGAQFLDDEALQAIEQAAPFPNPPRGLVDERTQQIVFTFGFTVELGERPIFRLRRYR
jgi:TonB family protein